MLYAAAERRHTASFSHATAAIVLPLHQTYKVIGWEYAPKSFNISGADELITINIGNILTDLLT